MRAGEIDGIDAAYALFANMPSAARDELKSALDDIGKGVLDLQKAQVPVHTGNLRDALTVDEALEQLRIRVGLVTISRAKGSPWYGRVVEFGRKAQVVTVKPRLSTSKRRLKAGLKARGSYALRVSALPPRPFVHIEDRIAALVENRLAKFWDATLAKAEA